MTWLAFVICRVSPFAQGHAKLDLDSSIDLIYAKREGAIE